MRKILGGLVATLLLGTGITVAHADKKLTGTWQEGDHTIHRVLLQRWGYTLGGPSFDLGDAQRLCAGSPVASVRGYRDAKDISYSIFSLGWYTPQHVRVSCRTAPATY